MTSTLLAMGKALARAAPYLVALILPGGALLAALVYLQRRRAS